MKFRQDSDEPCELVIALIGPIGCNRALVIDKITNLLKHYSYDTITIKVSGIISARVSGLPDNEGDHFRRVWNLMSAGNRLREATQDNGVLGKLVAAEISANRGNAGGNPSRKVAYIIDSIKRPEEIEVLKNIYGRGFYLFAISSPEGQRLNFLRDDCNIRELEKRERLLERDKNEESGHGQSTRDAFHLADFFVSETGNVPRLTSHIKRYLDIIFGSPFETPTFDEYAMFMAYAASTRSADLSRQVGAVITLNSEIISTGANECPSPGGGTYWRKYDAGTESYVDVEGGRDYKRGYDPNARERSEMIEKLMVGVTTDIEVLRSNIRSSGVDDITEFGRIVHAEMDAALECARRGISCKSGELYCTTFPCHNCAKHLVACGIRRVIFVEPYPKSKALQLHGDAITMADSGGQKVLFESFVGVGARQFINFFSLSLSVGEKIRRKSGSRVVEWNRSTARPRVKMFPASYVENEGLARQSALEAIEAAGGIVVPASEIAGSA